jgi:hypothetical protein
MSYVLQSCSYTTLTLEESRFFILDWVTIHPWLYSHCGPWPFFSFLIHTVGRLPWTGDQPVTRPLPTYRITQTQNKRPQTSMPWVGVEPTIPVFERAKTVHALDRAATVIGYWVTTIRCIKISQGGVYMQDRCVIISKELQTTEVHCSCYSDANSQWYRLYSISSLLTKRSYYRRHRHRHHVSSFWNIKNSSP